MKSNKRKSNKSLPQKKKLQKNGNSNLIRCNACKGSFKSMSSHFVYSKKCHNHYMKSNTIYVDEDNNEYNSYIGTSTNQLVNRNINEYTVVPSSINSIFGNKTIIRQMSTIPHQQSQIICEATMNNEFSIQNDEQSTNSSELHISPKENNDSNTNLGFDTDNTITPVNYIRNLCSVSNEIYQNHQSSQFEPTTLLSIKLFKILNKTNSPVYLFDEITEYIKYCYPIMKASNKRSIKSRKKLLEILYSIILNGSQVSKQKKQHKEQYIFDLYPHKTKLRVSQFPIDIYVTKFDVRSAIVSLLIDPIVMNKKNLLINDSTYTSPKNNDHDSYGDIHTGYWFRNAHSFLCKKDDDLLCPLIFFIDGVSLDSFGRQSLEPVTFTLGIFKRKARNSNIFWRILAYIPNLEKIHNVTYSNAQKKNNLKKIHYQELLTCILKELKSLQKEGGFRWKFPNGKEYNLKFPIMYIIGDAQGLDKICNRKVHYTPTKTFMTGCCRDCNSTYKHCHNPNFTCKFHKTNIIQRLSSDVLKSISYIPIKINAFAELCFGNDKHGLVGSCPPEPLHQWYLGVVELVLGYFWDRLTVPARSYLDNVIRGISKECGRQSDRDMPNISCFQKGLMKEKLTGMERGQQLFMLYLALLPSTVKQKIIILEQQSGNRYSRNKTKQTTITHSKILNSFHKYNKWLSIIESMISISQWLRLEEIPKADVTDNIEVCMKHDTSIFDCDELSEYIIRSNESNNIDRDEDLENDNDSLNSSSISHDEQSSNDTVNEDMEDNRKHYHVEENDPNSNKNTPRNNNINQANSSAISDSLSKNISTKVVKISRSEQALRNFLEEILDVFPKSDESKLQTLKLHQTVHYPHYIQKIGSVENFNGGPSEENMKTHVKNPGKRTQRRNLTLAYQCSMRYAEKLIVDISHNIAMSSGQYDTSLFQDISKQEYFVDVGMDNFYICNLDSRKSNENKNSIDNSRTNDTENENHIAIGSSSQIFTYDLSNENYYRTPGNKLIESKRIQLIKESSSFYSISFISTIMERLKHMKMYDDEQSQWHLCLFCKLKMLEYLFRCSPQFYGDSNESEWFDWITVNWDGEFFPAQLLMLINVESTCEFNGKSIDSLINCPDSKIFAVIKSGQNSTLSDTYVNNPNTFIPTFYDLHDELHIIDIRIIKESAFVIYDRDYGNHKDLQETSQSNFVKRIISIKDRNEWSTIFMDKVAKT